MAAGVTQAGIRAIRVSIRKKEKIVLNVLSTRARLGKLKDVCRRVCERENAEVESRSAK